jgi:dGTPase
MPHSMRMMHHLIRQQLEQREESLSPRAARSKLTRGRQRAEEPSPMRTEFQRDRDRIIHSKSFRRLMHKTQVFIAPTGDHYRTRLTHTLEVSQIARTIARALNLNEDLTEAIALGHDLGHTPFGHVGEEVLNELYPEGFRHNEQSLRVVELLENGGRGLNLTWEVRDGILNHSKTGTDVLERQGEDADTLEGRICKLADAVAYINHDIDDAIRAGIIAEDDLPSEATRILGASHRQRIDTLVADVIDSSWFAIEANEEPGIGMSPQIRDATNELRQFLFQKVYNILSDEAERDRDVVRLLYRHFTARKQDLPPEYKLRGESIERGVVDYIAGMTDRYAKDMFDKLNATGVAKQ